MVCNKPGDNKGITDLEKNTRLEVYLVGGALRDEMLELPVSDRDWVVVGAKAKDMQELGYRQVGKDFPVFLHPETHEEYALARTERKVSAGHQGFKFDTSLTVTLEDDLLRRDLTVNAIAKDANGTLIDPYHGVKDLEARVLRHVSPAFAEDPLRVLRVARFSAKLKPFGFSVADETMALMSEITHSGELQTLSVERIWAELQRAITYHDPQPFFDTLRECGALDSLLPEFAALYGVPQKAEYHPEIDCGIHTEMVLEQICKTSTDPVTRFAAICHDLGKATTPADILPGHHGHEERGAEITDELANRLRLPNDYRQLAVLTARYHTHCHRALELKASSVLKLIGNLDAIRRPARFEQYLQVCEADSRGRKTFEDRDYPQADFLRGVLVALQRLDTGAIAASAKRQERDIATDIRHEKLIAVKSYMKSISHDQPPT